MSVKFTYMRVVTASVGILICIFLFGIIGNGCSSSPDRTPPPPSKPGYPKPYRVLGKWYQPIPDSKGFKQTGIASWYGKDFHGKKTSNGEIYDMYAMTAAHKTLPLGTYVRVHNLENNRQVDLRINDRGPFVRGRIIDLSYTAANTLGVVGPGTAKVQVVAIGAPLSSESAAGGSGIQIDYYSGNFTFQVGAFTQRANAERLEADLGRKYKNAHITVFDRGDQVFYRVRVGKSSTLEQAAEWEDYLIQNGYPDAFAVAE
jgi:rare lipoprotein A